MRLFRLRRVLVALSALALVAASLTASMASVLEAASIVQGGLSTDNQPDAMPGCTDCGRNAVPANACAMHCVIPPADIRVAVELMPVPNGIPRAAPVQGFTGRVPAPDLHPPRAAA